MQKQETSSDLRTALEVQLARTELEMQEHYRQFGREMLELADREQRSIDRLLEQMARLRAQLTQEKRQISCPYCGCCGDADSIYCKRCGHKMKGENA